MNNKDGRIITCIKLILKFLDILFNENNKPDVIGSNII